MEIWLIVILAIINIHAVISFFIKRKAEDKKVFLQEVAKNEKLIIQKRTETEIDPTGNQEGIIIAS